MGIWSFIRKSAQSARGNVKPEDVIALKTLPEHILEDLYKDAFEKQLRMHPLFEFYGIIEPKCMSKLCRTGIEQHVLLSLEMLWHDLIVNRMLFVRRGTLHYEIGSLDLKLVVEPCQWACEEALWSERPHIDVPFSAGVSGCEMLMVNPNIFQDITTKYSQDGNSSLFLARYGEEFTRRFNEACHDLYSPNPLFNERDPFVDILKDVCQGFTGGAKKVVKTSSSRSFQAALVD